MSQMLADLGGGANGHEPAAQLPYDCPPWLPDMLWLLAQDPDEPMWLKIEALKLLALIFRWYEQDEDDFPIAEELLERLHQRRAYELAFALDVAE